MGRKEFLLHPILKCRDFCSNAIKDISLLNGKPSNTNTRLSLVLICLTSYKHHSIKYPSYKPLAIGSDVYHKLYGAIIFKGFQ